MTSGRLVPSVVLLGIDGAGKTTQVELLVRRLQSVGTPAVLYTRSAGVDVERHSVAERVALADTAAGWIAQSEQDAADRGAVWVSDRYADCHLAVDAVSRTPDPGSLLQVLANLYLSRPTVTVWLDLDPRIAQERILRRGYDEESLEYLVSLRDAYLALDAAASYVHIPADRPLDEVHERVWSVFTSVSASGPLA